MTQSYPLQWPEGWKRTPATQRRNHGPFQTTFDKARRMLLNEFRLLGATGVVISSWLPLRQDGQPYASAARKAIEDPGVAVYYSLRKRQMVMARDVYWNIHDNLRSIGLAIEHLRGLERHGGAAMMERAFEGFAALPPPSDGAPVQKPWREVLEVVDGLPAAVALELAELHFRAKARHAHPDTGGSAAAMADLNRAIAEARQELSA